MTSLRNIKGIHEYALYDMPNHYLVDYEIVANLNYLQETGRFMCDDEILINESFGFNKETLIDALELVGGGVGEVLLPGVPVDTAIDAIVTMDSANDTFQSIVSIGNIIPSISELFNALKSFDISAGFGAIYSLVNKVLNLMFKMKGSKFLEKIADALKKIIEKISRTISKFIGTLIPYDPGIVSKAVETGLSYAAESKNIFEIMVKSFNTVVPDAAKETLFDRNKSIGFFNSVINAFLSLLGMEKDDASKSTLNMPTSPAKPSPSIDNNNGINTFAALNDTQEKINESILSNITSLAKTIAPGMFDKLKEYLNSFKEKIPGVVDIIRYLMSLLFGLSAGIQSIMNKDYENPDATIDDQSDYVNDLKQMGQEFGEEKANEFLKSKGLGLDVNTIKNFDISNADHIRKAKDSYDKLNTKVASVDKSKVEKEKSKEDLIDKSDKKEIKSDLKDIKKDLKDIDKKTTKEKSKKDKKESTLSEVVDHMIVKWQVKYKK